jgi:hypothetical protein
MDSNNNRDRAIELSLPPLSPLRESFVDFNSNLQGSNPNHNNEDFPLPLHPNQANEPNNPPLQPNTDPNNNNIVIIDLTNDSSEEELLDLNVGLYEYSTSDSEEELLDLNAGL